MVAVARGVPVETTMGFTPAGGLVMGTRSGDLDPGVLVYLSRQGLDAEAIGDAVNRSGGMAGISGAGGDMRDLLGSAEPRAAEAVDVFCYQARKFLGALAAVLDGLDVLVFTGGIGEHAAPVRRRICDGLGYLGIELDAKRNEAHAPVVSTPASRVAVRVVPTDEDLMIARHTRNLISS